MINKIKSADLLTIFYGFLFSTLILIFASFGPIDDQLFFQEFRWLRFVGYGRLYLLDAIEQYGMLQLTGPSPFWFYLINSIEFLFLFLLIHTMTKKLWPSRVKTYNSIAVLITLTPGICTAYFRMFVPERLLVLCLSAIVLMDMENIDKNIKRFYYIVISLVAFLLKEPAFLVIGGISFFNFLKNKDKKFSVFMMCLSAFYGLVFLYVTHIVFPPSFTYGETKEVGGLVLRAKSLMNFLLNDPGVVLFAVPMWVYLFLKKRVVDSYLTIITGYLSVFLLLGIYQEYYLLPILPLLIVSIKNYWHHVVRPWKYLLLIFCLNSFIVGIAQISKYKNEPRGFSVMMDALAGENLMSGANVCYWGLDFKHSNEILDASGVFFTHITRGKIVNFVSVVKEEDVNRCDYLIESPYDYSGSQFLPKWTVLKRFQPAICIPNLSLKNWIKYFAIKTGNVPVVDKNFFKGCDFTLKRRP